MVQQIRLKLVMLAVCTLVPAGASRLYAQDATPRIKFYFQAGRSTLDRDYMSNSESLSGLDKVLLNASFLLQADSVIVRAGASPDGSYAGNVRLAQGRSRAIKDYMLRGCPELKAEKVKTHSRVTSWAELLPLAEQDPTLPHRAVVLSALSRHTDAAAIEQQLRGLGAGTVWQHIRTHYLPRFRQGDADIVFYYGGKGVTLDQAVDETIERENTPVPEPIALVVDSLPKVTRADTLLPIIIAEPLVVLPDTLLTTEPIRTGETERRPLFAVKTNLLMDAVMILNIEAEVPIGERWSVAGEWIFPWWLWKRKQICLQVLSGNIEGRYWLGNRQERPKLTGWFAGLYMGAGYYDLEWKTKGIQGEFFIAAGVSGGYAHTINRSGTLRMEYALGVGHLQTGYRQYKPLRGGEVLWRQRNGRHSWLGPTRAKVSLVWMINHKSRKGGAK